MSRTRVGWRLRGLGGRSRQGDDPGATAPGASVTTATCTACATGASTASLVKLQNQSEGRRVVKYVVTRFFLADWLIPQLCGHLFVPLF